MAFHSNTNSLSTDGTTSTRFSLQQPEPLSRQQQGAQEIVELSRQDHRAVNTVLNDAKPEYKEVSVLQGQGFQDNSSSPPLQLSSLSPPSTATTFNGRTGRNQNTIGISDRQGTYSAPENEPDPLDNHVNVEHEGGYGWLVLAATFVVAFWCLGVTFCWGVFQDFFIRNNTFPGVSAQDLSWTGSVSCATIFAGAPMVVVVVNRVGTVPIMVTGIFCVTLGFIGGSFALELWHLLLTIGFLYGFGGCVLYFTSLQVLSQYFVRRRAFVVGVAISGSGIGATTTAPLLRLILAKVGFRWAMRIFGGCMFVLLTMAACFIRPRRLPAFARPVQQQTLNHSLAQAANPNTAYGGPWRDAAASTMDSDYLDTGRHSRFERSISSIDLDSGHANSRPSPASASTLPESASPPSDDPNPGLDFGIFTVIPFTLVFIATNIFALVYLIPFLLAPSYATLIGLSPAQGASLVSICSAVGIVSRLAVGQLADRTGVLNWSIITSLLTGVSCLAFWLNARSYGALVAFMVLYGAFAGSTIMLLPVAATRAVSPDRMSSALGFVLFAHSIGYLFGTPFAQWIIAMQDGSYWGATTLVAAMNFVCGGILIFTRILTERRFWAVA